MRSHSFASGNETGMLLIDRKNGNSAMELSGEELDEYCRNRGLCNRCARVVTHKRVVKLFGKDVKWEPLTIRKEEATCTTATAATATNANDLDETNATLKSSEVEFSVYRGYCLKEHTCYTLAEAKRLLGETSESPKGKFGAFSRVRVSVSKNMLKRPGKRRMRTNPETGSISGSVTSFSSDLTGISRDSQGTSASQSSWISGLSRISGFSTRSKGSSGQRYRSGGKKKKDRVSRTSSLDSWSMHSFDPNNPPKDHANDNASNMDESEVTVEELDFSARTAPPSTTAGSAMATAATHSNISPIVAHRIEQLVKYDYFVVFYLCKIDLSTATGSANIDAIVHALRKAKTLESFALERCNLDDEGIEKIAGGLEAGVHFNSSRTKKGDNTGVLKTLRLKGNRIGNRGVQALEFLFRASDTLEELDLSDNCIGSKGAASVLESLGQNQKKIPLSILNLSQNEIWDLSGQTDNHEKTSIHPRGSSQRSYSFLHTNKTLRELYLEGNCLHDEGAEYIAEAISLNKHNCVLKKLHLGYNGIGDTGVSALAKTLESNNSVKVLGLAENDITNTGARALLSALAVNVSMKEISGLYHNRIDRKFIIVAIKRLLHRKIEHGFEEPQAGGHSSVPGKGKDASQKSSSNKSEQSLGAVEAAITAEETEETESTTTSSSTNEDTSQPVQQQHNNSGNTLLTGRMSSSSNGSLALEAIENWDWGTFGIDEIEEKSNADAESQIDQFLKDIEEEMSQDGDEPMLEDGVGATDTSFKGASQKSHKPSGPTDRLVVFQAAPLAYFDRKSMQHHGVPLLDFAQEAEAIKEVFSAQDETKGTVEVVFETATQNNFHNCFAKSWSPVMHFSCYGNRDCIALENGFGYMQALPLDALKKMVASATSSGSSSHPLQVVVVSSCRADYLAEAFLNAGVPRVVCLPRDATSFRDQGPIDFAKGFYGALQQSKSLQEAFDAGIKECTSKASSPKNHPPLLDSYKLLPEGANHDVNIFFQTPPPPIVRTMIPTDINRDEDPMAILPKLPDEFYGREVDIYEILESLRVDDVIRIGGEKGSGKKSILSVLSRYILERSKSFQIDSVFWLPVPSGIIPEPNSLYGALCLVFQWIMAAEDDIWDDDDYKQTRERILIEMEGRNSILVIDGRVFTNEIAGEMLERFLTHLLNEVNVKIILITAADTPNGKTKRSSSEESTIFLSPLNLKSTVKLYANACPLIVSSDQDGSNIDTVEEFESYLVPGSSTAKGNNTSDSAATDSKIPERSRRQNELYEFMGSGNPRDIIRRAKYCTPDSLSDLLKIAQRPDVSATTSKELEEQSERWTAEKEHAIKSKYYLRATDIGKTIEELKDLRKVYPSLDDMKAKEADLKKTFSALLKAKRYDDANFVKRKILDLKRTMMKEKFSLSSPKGSKKVEALNSINEIQERMKNMMALAESMNQSSRSFTTGEEQQAQSEASFFVSESCTLEISCGDLVSFWNDSSSTKTKIAMVVWANEACDLSGKDEVMQKLLGNAVGEHVTKLNTVAITKWGSVKCATGDSIVMNTNKGHIALAVPPLLPKHTGTKKDDKESFRYTEAMLSSAIRSSVRKIRRNNTDELVIGISTSLFDEACQNDTNETKEHRFQKLAVILHTVVKELRRVCHACGDPKAKTIVRLFASSGPAESLELIKIGAEHGLPLAQ